MANIEAGLEQFSTTGRFIGKEAYLEKNPDAILHDKCTDVVMYIHGHIIQALHTGEFYVDEDFSSRSLDEAETHLFIKKF